MRLLLLANPEASAYKRVKLDAVERQLADAHDVTMARTEERGHATALAREAAATGIEAVVVLGGGRHHQRGGQRTGRLGHRTGRPARRDDERVRPHHRDSQRPDQGR